MKVYVSHSRDFDYLNQLYKPIRTSVLNEKHDFYLPHEKAESINTKEKIKNSNLILAEVSFPSTGQGIELGWAENFNIPVLCLYKEGSRFSSSLEYITKDFTSYKDERDLIKKLIDFLSNIH